MRTGAGMNARESAVLRDLIARADLQAKGLLPPQRNRYRPWASEKRTWRAKRSVWCVYCGSRIRDSRGRMARGLTCVKHRDLPRLDPFYNPAGWSRA